MKILNVLMYMLVAPLVLLAASMHGVMAQSSADLEALKATLGEEKYETISEIDITRRNQMAYSNRHGYTLSDKGDKSLAVKELSEITPLYPHLPEVHTALVESGQWNMEGYVIPGNHKEYRYFSLPDSDKVLVILPPAIIKKRFEKTQQ